MHPIFTCTLLITLANAALAAESDKVPDQHEEKHPHKCPICVPPPQLLKGLTPAEIKGDPDGDGFSTEAELGLGTDPANADSHPWIPATLKLTKVEITSRAIVYKGSTPAGEAMFESEGTSFQLPDSGILHGWQVGNRRTIANGTELIALSNGRLVRWLPKDAKHTLPVSSITLTQDGTQETLTHLGMRGTITWRGVKLILKGPEGNTIKVADPQVGKDFWIPAASGKVKRQYYEWVDRVRTNK